MESIDLDCLVINELLQGMENANQLKFHLRSASPPNEAQEILLQRIICSYQKALMILKRNGSSDQAQISDPPGSVTVDGSPRSEDLNPGCKDSDDCSTTKKRKLRQATWTERVRVGSENGLEGPADDGFSWRKYGQKDILGAKYPRSYYRCTYRSLRNCWAMKQVQRSDEDPTVFEVTYKGAHTCAGGAVQPQASPDEKGHHRPQEHNNQALMNLKANLRVNTADDNYIPVVQFPFPCLDSNDHFFPSFSGNVDEGYLASIFASPETSESNYFSGFEGLTSFEHAENSIISGHASTSNSPIGGMEFAGESFDLLDSNFRFGPAGSFPSL